MHYLFYEIYKISKTITRFIRKIEDILDVDNLRLREPSIITPTTPRWRK